MEVSPLNEMKEATESGLMLITVLVTVAVLRSNSQKGCTVHFVVSALKV